MREVIIFSIVQGICEWFPISSSGHLFLIRKILGLTPDITLDIFLHFSSIFVIFIFFRKEILKITRCFFLFKKNDENFKIGIYIILATFITCIIGVLIKDRSFLENKHFVSSGFLLTTLLLFFSDRKGERKIDIKSSLLIGFSQGLSLIPGVSRSGTTISTAKILKINDTDSFNFSFLLAIPAIIGAIIIKMNEITSIKVTYLIIGFLISFIVGLITVYLLKRIFLKKEFKYFCIYTFIIFLLTLFIK